jgi:hypothetical protein
MEGEEGVGPGEGSEGSDVLVTPPPSQQMEIGNDYGTEAVEEIDLMDPYSEDPIFSSVEAMRKFVRQREPSPDSSDTEPAAGVSGTQGPRRPAREARERECTCGRCTELHHAGGDHLCCRQLVHKWDTMLEDGEDKQNLCLTETAAFKAITSEFSVRVLVLSRWDTSGIPTTDPPQHEKMRHNSYVAMSYHLDGKSRTRKPLPACVMSELRKKYPSDVYTGYND